VPFFKQLARPVTLLSMSMGLAFPNTTSVPYRTVTFEPNVGQTDTRVKFLAHAANATLWLTEEGAVLHTAAGPDRKAGSVVLKLRFDGANPRPQMEGEDQRQGVSNYFLGRDAGAWHTGIRQFGKVRYRNVYTGIDVVFYGNPKELEYDFVVRPGADPAKIRLAFDGADRIVAEASGDLRVQFAGVEIRSRKPRIYQTGQNGDRSVDGRYVVKGRQRAGFIIDPYDATRPLIVDPVLSYATFFGGLGGDVANAVAMDAQGAVYVAGSTNSAGFPTKAGIFPGLNNDTNVAFVAKFNTAASGSDSLIYSTYLGGDVSDEAFGIAVDANGNAYVAGRTLSTTFPLKNAFQSSFSTATNCKDAGGTAIACTHSFITEIAASGKALVYSSYLGGTNQDEAFAVGVDAAGNAYITGQTLSTDFPTAGSAYQTSQKGSGDAFLSEVAAGGKSLAYSTYFGGAGVDSAVAIAVAPSGTVYIAGSTASTDLPTSSNAYQGAASGTVDAFVAEFNLKQGSSGQLVYSTYLGGKDGATSANAVAVDAAGLIYLTGATNAASYPVSSSAFRTAYAGSLASGSVAGVGDAFITKLDPSEQPSAQLVYSTFLGGALDDSGAAIAVDSAGRITVAGQTNSLAFPVTGNALQTVNDGPSPTNKGYIARFDPSKSGNVSLLYSTYLGGNLSDSLFGLAMDKTGNSVVVVGTVFSFNPPITTSAFQKTFGGSSSSAGDAYIAVFNFAANGPFCKSIMNGASFVDTGLSPGLIFTIKGTSLGPAAAQRGELDSTGKMATTLAGVQVLVNSTPAPLLYVQERQINAVVPYELLNSLGDIVNVQVIYNGVGGNLIADTAVIAAPAIFSLGNSQGAILNQDNTVNGPGNPAAKGSTIQIFATGEGPIHPDGVDGRIVTSSNLPHPLLPVSVMIGGVKAGTSYAGTVPESFEGFFQVNATIPGSVASGNVPVVLIVGGTESVPVNVAVK
jgi:uncharacterized protein (TIGR03437 family)